VLIGNGSVEQAREVRSALELPDDLVLVTDPRRESFSAAGLRRDLAGVVSPRSISAGLRAWGSGARVTGLKGDPWQLGGVIAVDRDGRIRYRYASSYAGDHPPLDQPLAALES